MNNERVGRGCCTRQCIAVVLTPVTHHVSLPVLSPRYEPAATIRAIVEGTANSGADMPGQLIFATTPDGTKAPVDRLKIMQSGKVVVGGFSGGSVDAMFEVKTFTGNHKASCLVHSEAGAAESTV